MSLIVETMLLDKLAVMINLVTFWPATDINVSALAMRGCLRLWGARSTWKKSGISSQDLNIAVDIKSSTTDFCALV